MLTSNLAFLPPELMDVVRLFAGAEALAIEHTGEYRDGAFYNRFVIEGAEYSACDEGKAEGELQYKSLCKRYAKLALYRILSARTGEQLPWGALTGIRPTRLAYAELEAGRPFEPLFETMGVSEENIALVRRVIAGQAGIYERKEGNCDLFVSLPFCPSKCTYCSFITAPIAATRKYLSDYLAALEEELAAAAPLIGNLRSVYVGGGTPFALEAEELECVLAAIAPLRTNGCEYTVEAGRPDVFSREKLDVCARYGVTRICINAQSFSDQTLAAIGRRHTAEDLYRAFDMAKDYPFDVNCDLIAGLTGESVEEFCQSVDAAIALAPENITVHTLCLKKGAKLKEETARLEAGRLSEMIAYSRRALTAAGIGLGDFRFESVSLPPELEKALDENTRLNMMRGNIDVYTQMAQADAMKEAAKNGGAAGSMMGAGLGMGLGMQMAGAFAQKPEAQPAKKVAKGAFCPECGAQVSAGAKFCPECGKALQRACPACGAALSANAKFCPECGQKL